LVSDHDLSQYDRSWSDPNIIFMKPQQQQKKKRSADADTAKMQWPAFSPWPLIWCVGSVLFYAFHTNIHAVLPGLDLMILRNISAVAIFYSFGWLLARSFRAFVARKGKAAGRRKAPRLLSELVSVTLFTIATMLAIGLL